MNGVQRILVSIQKKVDKVNKILVIFFLSGMIVLVGSSVFMRYVLDTGLSWCEDIVTLLFSYLIFFSFPLALRSGAHIRIVVFTNLLPEKIGKVLNVIVDFMVLITFFLIFMMSVEAIPVIGVSPYGAIKYPMSLFYYGAAIACVVMFLDTIILILNDINGKGEQTA